MRSLLYATGNSDKFRQAQFACRPAGIELIQNSLEVPEIQGEDERLIALDKAAKAYAKFKEPLIISDDSWIIPGLNGFPGPYMKSMGLWLTAVDWLNLTRGLSDRRVILRQLVVYQDTSEAEVIFAHDINGVLLTDLWGNPKDQKNQQDYIVSFDGGTHSIAELNHQGKRALADSRSVWDEFVEWYTQKVA